jgi:hypothetical protein
MMGANGLPAYTSIKAYLGINVAELTAEFTVQVGLSAVASRRRRRRRNAAGCRTARPAHRLPHLSCTLPPPHRRPHASFH